VILYTNASHELKTPLSLQRLFFGEALQRDDLPDDFRMRLSSQSEILFRMDRLVKSLLDLSVLEFRETFSPEAVDLHLLVSCVLAEFKEIIQAAEIHLSVNLEEIVRVKADEEKMRRMVINLIDNAIKYNREENGEIRVLLKEAEKNVLLEVYNTGRGIPKGELKKLFDQFYRVEKSRSSSYEGAGLGLTIVKRIVQLHRGKVEIRSEYGHWVRVRIQLPLSSIEEETPN